MMQMDQHRRCRLLDRIPKRKQKCNAAGQEKKIEKTTKKKATYDWILRCATESSLDQAKKQLEIEVATIIDWIVSEHDLPNKKIIITIPCR